MVSGCVSVCGGRRLYPVDMARVNEFGQTFDDSADHKQNKKTQ